MINSNNYQLIIEPYVYISVDHDSLFLYNTLNGDVIESSERVIIELVKRIKDNVKDISFMKDEIFINNLLEEFIDQLKEKHMGYVITESTYSIEPVQFFDMSNLKSEITKLIPLKKCSDTKYLLSHLHEISFFLDSPDSFASKYYPSELKIFDGLKSNYKCISLSQIASFLDHISGNIKINIVVKDLFLYKEYEALINILNQLSFEKRYVVYYKCFTENEKMKSIEKKESFLEINIDFPINESIVNEIMVLVNEKELKYQYSFLIRSEHEYKLAEQYIVQNDIHSYNIIPIYSGGNITFFEENIYISEEDFKEEPTSLREIFIRQVLNRETYGNISITNSGDVFSCIYEKKIGNIIENSLSDILYTEINIRKSWQQVRDKEPCNKCHYQWLCPSPSIYETILNKNNLCNIYS